ncbi:MAG: NADH-quinone oxidoreductase subunit I [Dehalococcoidia bacterium]|nr:NADH-quinone oxidoreductase subunit I [Dehalococcoidia bacterium]MDP6782064.1 NADH-quinone oxidoreductase subunit I [Dehalococcoidia bacterium]
MSRFDRFGLGLAKGLALTGKTLFSRPNITVQYPEQRLDVSRRLRGPELIWVSLKCTGCATCAKSCPQGSIQLVTSPELVDNKYQVEEFLVDHGRCMFCGLCVEACPFDALYMGRGYERAAYRRGDLILPKEKLQMSADRKPSAYCRPEMEAELPLQTLLVYGQTRAKR